MEKEVWRLCGTAEANTSADYLEWLITNASAKSYVGVPLLSPTQDSLVQTSKINIRAERHGPI